MMKKTIFAISAALVMFAGCKKTDITVPAGMGTVSFSLSNEENSGYVVKSSAPEADVNTFKINIKSEDGSYDKTWNAFSEMESVLELVSGTYTVTATSPENKPVAFDQPVYGATKSFAVKVGAVSNVDLVCSIQNMMVTMEPTEDFKNELSSYEITVKSDDGTLIWTKDEVEAGKAGFFAVSPLEVWVKGTRHNGEAAPQQYLKIDDVAAKDHHIIKLDAKVTGDAGIGIEIDNTVNDREENITVPGFDETPVDGGDDNTGDGGDSGDGEDPQPSTAPTIVWEDNPTFEDREIISGMSVEMQISAPEKIKTFTVNVVSTCANFMSAISGMVSEENNKGDYVVLDLINDGTAMETLAALQLPTGDALKGQTSVLFSLTNLIPLIDMLTPAPGDRHTFTLNVTDEKDQPLSQAITFITPAE